MNFNEWYYIEGLPIDHYEIVTSMSSGRESGGEKCYIGWWLDNVRTTIQFNEWASTRDNNISLYQLKEPRLSIANKKKMIRDIFKL